MGMVAYRVAGGEAVQSGPGSWLLSPSTAQSRRELEGWVGILDPHDVCVGMG